MNAENAHLMAKSAKASPSKSESNPKKESPFGATIWMDGEWLDFADATTHVMAHAMHYGVGIFEGIRCYRINEKESAIFRLDDHVDRLFSSAKIVGIKLPHAREELRAACVELVRRNRQPECYIRPLSYIGQGPVGVYPGTNPPINTFIATWKWGAYLGDEGLKKGIRCQISTFTRGFVNHTMTKGKITGNYVNSALAKSEAISNGFQEAILLDTEGFVSEGSGENIFIVRQGKLKTTPLTSILDGITRRTVFELADSLGLEVQEVRFTRDELYIADEAFFTGTAAEITPISEVDRRPIGDGSPGPITKRLQSEFFAVVRGEKPAYRRWLAPVLFG